MSQSKYRLALKGVDEEFYSAYAGNPKTLSRSFALRSRYLPGTTAQGSHPFLPIWLIDTDQHHKFTSPGTGCDNYIKRFILIKAHVNDLCYVSIDGACGNATDTIERFKISPYETKAHASWGVRKCVVLAEVSSECFLSMKECINFYSRQLGIPAATQKDFSKPSYNPRLKLTKALNY